MPLLELDHIYNLSRKKNAIIKAAAKLLAAIQDQAERDAELAALENQDLKNNIIKELIILQNELIQDEAVHFPVLNPGQAYVMNTKRPIGYLYFNNTTTDENGNIFEEPSLLTSDRRIINLCNYSRHTSNQLLIIDGQFRIRSMVKGPLLDSDKISLKVGYVKRYLSGEIDAALLIPSRIVREFEAMFRRIYYSKDPNLYKLLALYCFSTYFADLFGVLPYIYITAEKGSGKSTILSLLEWLCFNSVFVTDASAASIFRICNIGSTLIVDEFENRSSRYKNAEDDIVPLLKAGYSKSSGGAIRVNMEETYKVDCYSVYSPKVFAAIGELDDVLRDRSICIVLSKLPASEIKDVMDLSVFYSTYAGELARLSSYAALSALEHFQSVFEHFNAVKTHGESARANQILKPLYSLAEIIGEDYVGAVDSYSHMNEQSKAYVDSQSVEGAIKEAIQLLALTWFNKDGFNRYGIVPQLQKDKGTNRYQIVESSIKVETGVAEQVRYDGNDVVINTVYLTLLANQLYDFGTISLKQVHTALSRIMPDKPLTKSNRTTTSLRTEDHKKFFGRNCMSSYNIHINVANFGFDKIQEQLNEQLQNDLTQVAHIPDAELEF